ncbi:hypothetical protein FD754_011157, partial [Muntiacus muntjak]
HCYHFHFSPGWDVLVFPKGPSIGLAEVCLVVVVYTFPAFGRDVCCIDHSMCPVPSTFHREPVCCECLAKFGGYLPVPRAKAALPYWVPLSLRPQNQIQKMVQSYIPKTTKACLCPCHRFGGHLPMPRDQAVMPYWVPQVLRSHKKVVKRQQSFKGISDFCHDGYNTKKATVWHTHHFSNTYPYQASLVTP